jgi:putative DNA primase/helicase
MAGGLFQYAKAYLALGWQPIPVHYAVGGVCSCHRGKLCHTPGKHPVPQLWQKSVFNEDALSIFWGENKDYNIGLVTGQRTNLVALDIDANKHGYESLRDLEDKHGILPDTTTAATGGGGRHYLFQYPAGIVIPTKGNIRPGLDVRGEGGQIVAPPSYHDAGHRRYSWMPGLNPHAISPVPMPEWLIAILESQETLWLGEAQATEDSADVYYGTARNTSLFTLGRRLRVIKDLNADELHTMLHSLNKSKCRPPMDEDEVDRIVTNVLRKEGSQTIVPAAYGGEEPPLVKVLPVESIWEEDVDKPIPYVIPNLLSEGEICLLASPTEAGKSLLAMSLSVSVAAGLPAWGRGEACPQGRVMYCTEELAGRTIKSRFRKLAHGLKADKELLKKNLLIVPQQNLSLALARMENIEALILLAQQFRPTLVILDTFVSYFGAPEKDAEVSRAWFGAVPIALRTATNCAVIVQHHTRKQSRDDKGQFVHYSDLSNDELNNEIRGTSDLAGVSERIWFIWKKSEERNDFGPTVQVNFRNTKAREGDKHDPITLVISDLDEYTTTVQSAIAFKSKKHMQMEKILKSALFPNVYVSKVKLMELLVAKGLSRPVAYRWIDFFTDDGTLLLNAEKQYSLNLSQLLLNL